MSWPTPELMDRLEAEFPDAVACYAQEMNWGSRWGIAIDLGDSRRRAVSLRSPDDIDEAIGALREWATEQEPSNS